MSSLLLRQELDQQIQLICENKRHSKKAKKLIEQLPTTRHGLKKQLQKLKKANCRPKFHTSQRLKVQFLSVRAGESERSKRAQLDELKCLVSPSSSSGANNPDVSGVLDYLQQQKPRYVPKGRSSAAPYRKPKRSKERKQRSSGGTAFTEEDFANFAKQYFIKSAPISATTLAKLEGDQL